MAESTPTPEIDNTMGTVSRLQRPEKRGLRSLAKKVGPGQILMGCGAALVVGTIGADSFFARASDVADLSKRTATLEQHDAAYGQALGDQSKKIDWLTDVTYRQAQREGLPVAAPPPASTPTPAAVAHPTPTSSP